MTNTDLADNPVPEENAGRAETPAGDAIDCQLEADQSLQAYTRTKQEAAKRVRAVLELLRERGDEQRVARCQELLVKLAEDRFNLVVLGQFKRGKSSLMNAIIGRDLLPTGLLPLTSVVTALRFGPKERLVLTRDTSWSQEAPISALAQYVTERGNPGNEKKIKEAFVELSVGLLRRGLHFVDTPGVGSIHEQNTATTYAFLPECDAALLVTSVDTPLTELEVGFLKSIREHVRKVFFVANKTDLLAPEEREDVLQFIRDGLARATEDGTARLFPVSSREALEARQSADAARYEHSGMKALEDALASFLTTEKSRAFLVSILDRALRLLGEEQTEVELQRKAAAVSKEDREAHRSEIALRIEALDCEREELLASTRSHLSEWAGAMLTREIASVLHDTREELHGRFAALPPGSWRLSSARFLRQAMRQSRNEMEAALRAWFQAQWPHLQTQLGAIADEAASQLEKSLKAALRDIAVALESQVALDIDAELPANNAFSVTRLAALPSPHWQPDLPGWLWLIPTAVGRSRLRRQLEDNLADLQRLLEPALREVIDSVVAETMESITKHCQSRIGDFRRRVDALVTGKALPNNRRGVGARQPTSQQDLDDLSQRVLDVRRDLISLRDVILASAQQAGTPKVPLPEKPAGTAPVAASVEAAAQGTRRSNLSKDLRTRGCPVCDRISEAAFDFFAKWQYTLGHDAEAQQAYVATRGFCALHTWQFEAIASPQGLDFGYPPLLDHLAAQIREIAQLPLELAIVKAASLVPRSRDCLACGIFRDVEATNATRLLAYLESDEGRKAYARSQGVCLPHLLVLLTSGASSEVAAFLLSEQARHFAETGEDMGSYTLKFDAVRRGLLNKDEEDAHLRALVHLVGSRAVAAPWQEDGA